MTQYYTLTMIVETRPLLYLCRLAVNLRNLNLEHRFNHKADNTQVSIHFE